MAKIHITKTELVWPGKYNNDGTRKEIPRVSLPFQVIETINQSRATRERSRQAASTDPVRHLRRQGKRHLRRGLDKQAAKQACTSGSINMSQTTSGKYSVSWLFDFRLLRLE